MSNQRILLDAGPLVALLAEHDQRHRTAQAAAALARFPLVTCWPVITEAAYLLQRQGLPAESALKICQSGDVVIETLTLTDLTPISLLLQKYRDLELQMADACLLQLADRMDLDYILTFDRRDFGAARTPSGRSLTILPEA